MSQYNSQVQSQGLRRRAAWLFMAFACGSYMLSGSSKSNGGTTAPLQREIKTLKDQFTSMEARHETLEAATEGFRMKAKRLQDKSDDVQNRYDSLLASKTEVEEILREEIMQVQETERSRYLTLESEKKTVDARFMEINQKLLDESTRSSQLEMEKIALEGDLQDKQIEYDSILKEKSDVEEKLEKALAEIDSLQSKKSIIETSLKEARRQLEEEVARSQRLGETEASNKDGFQARIEQLLISIQERDEELTKSKNIYAELQEELLTANTRLGASQEVAPDQKETLKQEETLSEVKNGLFATIAEKLFGLLKGAVQMPWTMVHSGHDTYMSKDSQPDTPASKFHLFSMVSMSYTKSHQCAIEWLDSIATAFQDGEDDSSSSWLRTGGLFVKANCELIVLLAEMLVALFCVDFAVSSMINWWSETQAGQKRLAKVSSYDDVPPRGSLLQNTSYIGSTSRSWLD
jgi:myosin heavy subunit